MLYYLTGYPYRASTPLRLAYQVFGAQSKTNSPILILHGMFGSSNNWRSLGKKIASEIGTAVRYVIYVISLCVISVERRSLPLDHCLDL